MEPFHHTQPARTYRTRELKFVLVGSPLLLAAWLYFLIVNDSNNIFILIGALVPLISVWTHKLIVSPAGISYHILGHKAEAPWSDVERIEQALVRKKPVSYLVFRRQIADPGAPTQVRVSKHLRGRAMPLQRVWANIYELEQTIRQHAPQVLEATSQAVEGYGQPISAAQPESQGLFVPSTEGTRKSWRSFIIVLVVPTVIMVGLLAFLVLGLLL